MRRITSTQEFQTLRDSRIDFILYKHSPTCSISDKACRTIGTIIDELQLENIYMLDVLNTGKVKYEIADLVGVRHESPQVLIFRNGNLIAHASHLSITAGRFRQHLLGWHDTRKRSDAPIQN